MNKDILIEEIEKGKQVFNSLINEISKDDLVRPGVCGDWSVKDIVAHIVVHEQRMLRWMDERIQGGNPVEHQPYDSPDEQLDALNHQIYLDHADRPWADVLQDWESTHEQTLTWIQRVNEEDLFDSGRFQLLGGEPLWAAVAANTFEHCEEHAVDIRGWMGKSSDS